LSSLSASNGSTNIVTIAGRSQNRHALGVDGGTAGWGMQAAGDAPGQIEACPWSTATNHSESQFGGLIGSGEYSSLPLDDAALTTMTNAGAAGPSHRDIACFSQVREGLPKRPSQDTTGRCGRKLRASLGPVRCPGGARPIAPLHMRAARIPCSRKHNGFRPPLDAGQRSSENLLVVLVGSLRCDHRK
jgi:hypothetical protein